MGFLRLFRRTKSPKKNKTKALARHTDYSQIPSYTGPDQTRRLDDKILRLIFHYVCLHSSDDTLEPSEESGYEGCMTCDTRDLAHCALTSRQWYSVAAGLL